MKPHLQLSQLTRRGDAARPLRRGFVGPQTDCFFRPSYGDDFFSGRGGERKRFASFRKISEDYFGSEARRHFKGEAAFFALIVATVALPLFEVARSLSVWIR